MTRFKRLILDGPDMAGKTYTLNTVKKELDRHGINSVVLRFPTAHFREGRLWKEVVTRKSYDLDFIYEWVRGRIEDVFGELLRVTGMHKQDEPLIILEDRGMLSTIVYQFRMLMKGKEDLFDQESRFLTPQALDDLYHWYNYVITMTKIAADKYFPNVNFNEKYVILNQKITFDPTQDIDRNSSTTDNTFESKKKLTEALYVEVASLGLKSLNQAKESEKFAEKSFYSIEVAHPVVNGAIIEKGYDAFYKTLNTPAEADISTMRVVSQIMESINYFI